MQQVRRIGRAQRLTRLAQYRVWLPLAVLFLFALTFIAGVNIGTNVTLAAVDAAAHRR